MKVQIKEKFKVLTPSVGMVLTDGNTYTKDVTMPLEGNEEVWQEVKEPENETEEN